MLVVLTGVGMGAQTSWCLCRNGGARRMPWSPSSTVSRTRVGERFADENAAQTRARLRDDKLRQPWWLEYSASFFPVILVVFVVRSFVVEPFKIPSGSMVPTLLVGDFILVNKFDYGLRLPIVNTKITEGTPLQRGDVVGVPLPEGRVGRLHQARDRLAGRHRCLSRTSSCTINGKPVPETPLPDYLDEERSATRSSSRKISTAARTRF